MIIKCLKAGHAKYFSDLYGEPPQNNAERLIDWHSKGGPSRREIEVKLPRPRSLFQTESQRANARNIRSRGLNKLFFDSRLNPGADSHIIIFPAKARAL